MNTDVLSLHRKSLSLVLLSLFFLGACDKGQDTAAPATPAAAKVDMPKTETVAPPVSTPPTTPVTEAEIANKQLDIGNTQYLFIAAEHTPDELQSLLQRVEEITQSSSQLYDQLDIALVIHGENVHMFTEDNYEQNKMMIDLAAKLDALDVIDMKVCEWSMSQRGVSPTELPSFVDPVPFAPDEIKRLTEAGYINL